MISVLIFTRDDADWLGRLLSALRADPPSEPFEVLIFDNRSQDDTASRVRAWQGPAGERAALFVAQEDTSFSQGNNWLLEAARGELALFLNPDTEPTGGLLDAAAAHLRAQPDVHLVGPRLRFPDGSHQSNGWALPTPLQLVREHMGEAEREAPSSGTGATDVGWLMGCFLMGRTTQLRALGGFDERYWFLATDLEFCARAGRQGRVVRLDEHELLHRGHQAWPPDRRRASRRATLSWILRNATRSLG